MLPIDEASCVILSFLSDIITLARCVILQVQSCITPILHHFACKYTILLRVKLHFRSWCNNTHKKTDSGAEWQQFYTIF